MAKVGSRAKDGKVEDKDLFVVVAKDTGKRMYVGPGAPEEEATRLAGSMVTPSKAVPATEVTKGVWTAPTEG